MVYLAEVRVGSGSIPKNHGQKIIGWNKEVNIIHGFQAGRFNDRKAEVTFALGVVPLVNE